VRERYTYEISTSESGDRWNQDVLADDTFSRDPRAVARALLESWVIDNPGRVTGGERILVRHAEDPGHTSEQIAAKVRVRVFRGGLRDHPPHPVAIGYLGHRDRDFPVDDEPSPLDQLKAKGRELASNERVRKAQAVARKAARDPRVGAGAGAVLALIVGWFATRHFRGRGKGSGPA
jgi:hypothetical protein